MQQAAAVLADVWEEGFTAKAWRTRPTNFTVGPDFPFGLPPGNAPFPPSGFEYVPWDAMPLTSLWSPFIATFIYVAACKVLPWWRRGQPAMALKLPLLIHNLVLVALSLLCFVGVSVAVLSVWLRFGFWSIWIDPYWLLPSTSVSVWTYLFYVSKFYELVDTLFLLLKNKVPRLVQTVHHTSVLFLFWAFGNARMTNHWFLMFCNSFVHIFVYGYFACSTLGIPVPWKKYITLMQITQFFADILWALGFPFFHGQGWTHGDSGPVLLGNVIGVIFIILFTQVYFVIKAEQRAAAARATPGAGNAVGRKKPSARRGRRPKQA